MDSQTDNEMRTKKRYMLQLLHKPELTGVQKKDSGSIDFYDGQRLIRSLKYKTPEKAGFSIEFFWEWMKKVRIRPSRKFRRKRMNLAD